MSLCQIARSQPVVQKHNTQSLYLRKNLPAHSKEASILLPNPYSPSSPILLGLYFENGSSTSRDISQTLAMVGESRCRQNGALICTWGMRSRDRRNRRHSGHIFLQERQNCVFSSWPVVADRVALISRLCGPRRNAPAGTTRRAEGWARARQRICRIEHWGGDKKKLVYEKERSSMCLYARHAWDYVTFPPWPQWNAISVYKKIPRIIICTSQSSLFSDEGYISVEYILYARINQSSRWTYIR